MGKSADAIMRCDLLLSNLTARKEVALRSVLASYRKGACAIAKEQWRLFFETGRFNKNHDRDKVTFKAIIGNAARVQMCRWQVTGQLQSFIANRANEFRDLVQRSSLRAETKHQLHQINRREAWFTREPVMLDGKAVPTEIQHLARCIMRHVMGKHRKPDMAAISMRLDQRAGAIARPIQATQAGKVGWWVNLSTLVSGKKIALPLLTYDHHENRTKSGKVANGVLVTQDRDSGQIRFGIVTDITEACSQTQAAYESGCDALPLDFGLSTFFVDGNGAQLGQGWLKALRRFDQRITAIARGMQRRGQKPRQSLRYRATVANLRGFIKTEVNRVLNRLINLRRPAVLILERLNFQNPALSKRLNRILQNCGRSAIRAKLQDLADRFNVEAEEVNPAFTSQACSACGYVDKRNRTSQAVFHCLWCGKRMHADANASRNIGARRADPIIGSVYRAKAAILAELVRRFSERRIWAFRSIQSGGRGSTADPRLTNPYFKGIVDASRMSCGEMPLPSLVAA